LQYFSSGKISRKRVCRTLFHLPGK